MVLFIRFQRLISTTLLVLTFILRVTSQMQTDDKTKYKWAHAVNSFSALEEALSDRADFIEADVSYGRLFGDEPQNSYPIMAHSANDVTDASLDQWIQYFLKHNTLKKGMKLDFKDIKSATEAVPIIKKHLKKDLDIPLWINADILSGIMSNANPVNAESFIKLWSDQGIEFIFSLGWTTDWHQNVNPVEYGYSWPLVYSMYETLSNLNILSHRLTFPLRAIYCRQKSIEPLQWLASVTPNSTFSIWAHATDEGTIPGLETLLRSFPKNKMYFDIPDSFLNKLNSTQLQTPVPTTFHQHDMKLDESSNITYITVLNTPSIQNVSVPFYKDSVNTFSFITKPLGYFASNKDIILALKAQNVTLDPFFEVTISKSKIELIGSETHTHNLNFSSQTKNNMYLNLTMELTLSSVSLSLDVFTLAKSSQFLDVNMAKETVRLQVPNKYKINCDYTVFSVDSSYAMLLKDMKFWHLKRQWKTDLGNFGNELNFTMILFITVLVVLLVI